MRTKKVFLIVTAVLVFSLVAWGLIGLFTGLFVTEPDSLTVYSVFLDFVLGLLTVWGLYWAASEFGEQSVKPRLTLLLGAVRGGPHGSESDLIEDLPARLEGHKSVNGERTEGRLDVGLFLENHEPKMAQHLQVIIEVESEPITHEVHPLDQACPYGYHGVLIDNRRVMMQFEDDLIVYKGQGVYIGILRLWWRQTSLPSACKLNYKIYKSEGEPDSGRHDIAIQWS